MKTRGLWARETSVSDLILVSAGCGVRSAAARECDWCQLSSELTNGKDDEVMG